MDAFCANQVTAHQVAAVIADGLGRLRHGHVRFDLLWTVWTIPWDLIRGIGAAIGRRLACTPLVQFAWRIRLVVGSIAVILETQAGRWPSPIITPTFIALSYLLPGWTRAWEQHLTHSLDDWPAAGWSTKVSAQNRETIHPERRCEGPSHGWL